MACHILNMLLSFLMFLKTRHMIDMLAFYVIMLTEIKLLQKFIPTVTTAVEQTFLKR